jgi:hypothetical protein
VRHSVFPFVEIQTRRARTRGKIIKPLENAKWA